MSTSRPGGAAAAPMSTSSVAVRAAELAATSGSTASSRYRKDEDDKRFLHILSETDQKLQEMEAQRILNKLRDHSKRKSTAAKKAWGSAVVTDDNSQRSLSRPILSPSNVAARSMSAERRHQAMAAEPGLPSTALLAPTGVIEIRAADAAPGSSMRPRPGSAASTLHSPLRPGGGGSGSAAATSASAASLSASGFLGSSTAAPGAASNRSMVAKLEAEVKHLRETIGVLLEGSGSGSGAGAGNATGVTRPRTAGARSAAGAGAGAGASVSFSGRGGSGDDGDEDLAGAESRGDESAAEAVGAALSDKERAEAHIAALERAKRRLAATSKALASSGAAPPGMPASRLRPASAAAAGAAAGGQQSPVASPRTGGKAGVFASARAFGPGAGRAAASRDAGDGKDGAEGKEGEASFASEGFSSSSGIVGEGQSASSSSASAVPMSAQLEAAFREGGDSDEEAAQRKRVTRPQEFSFMARLKSRGRPATPGAHANANAGAGAASPGGGRLRSSSRRGSKDSRASSKGRGESGADGDAGAGASGSATGASGAAGDGAGEGELDAHVSIAARRAEEERKAREAEIESHLSFRFRAMPVPEAVRLPMFALLAEKAEARRRAEHEARAAELAASSKPFQQLMEHEEAMRARGAARRARLELAQARELSEGRRFKAVPIPATTTAPDGEYMKLLARERERPLRVMSAARALAASASLPPRMALAQEAERRRQAERDAAQRAAEAAERRLARFRAAGAPDFNVLHEELEHSMREGRRTFAATTPAPFAFDSTERQAAEAARREARQREFELATSPSMALRALSASAREGAMAGLGGRTRSASRGGRGRPLSATGGSGFAPGASGGSLVLDRSTASAPGARGRSAGARPVSAGGALGGGGVGLDGSMSMSVGGGGLGGSMSMHGAPPPAAMTRTVQLRMLDVQRRVRERQAAERAAAVEAEDRAARTRAATKALAPVVQRLEAERNPVPLAWQGDPTGGTANAATLAKQRFEATARANMEEQRRRVEAAQAARPLLMLRGTLETRREEARRAALIDAARRIGEPGETAWQQVVAGGLGSSGGGSAASAPGSAARARSRSAGTRSHGGGANRHDDEDDEFADLGDEGEDGSALFDAEERELLSLLARQKAAAQAASGPAGGAGASASLASSKGGRR